MEKNELFKYNKKYKFDEFTKMIKFDISKHEKELLFEEESINFDNNSDKLLKDSYYIYYNQQKNYQNYHYSNNKFQNQTQKNPNKNFKRSSKVIEVCKQEEIFYESIKKINNNINENQNKDERKEKNESFLDNNNEKIDVEKEKKNKKKVKKPEKEFIECEIDMIFEINEKLNFSKDDKFWYIYTDIFKSSYGPFSSNEIVILYMEKKIDGNSLIRPLDIFKNTKGNDFQKLLKYDNKSFFFNNYYISDKCSDYEFKFKEFRRKEEEQLKLEKEKEEKIKKEKEEEKKKKEEEIKNQKEKEKEDKLNKEKIENEKLNEKQNENEEINTTSSSKTENHISINENHPIMKKKKKKAKMIDLNIKTGFYTMTNQEKNFSEVYICGDNELLNNVPKK
jgi:hypothetical protein